jgi:hypothetical protein
MNKKANDNSQLCLRPARRVRDRDVLILYARAAGRCSFRGCNDNIVEHHLTREPGNFGQAAHIFAFRERGPRGDEPGRPDNPDTLENLILLCPKCHKKIDDEPEKFSVGELRRHRDEHEARVRRTVDVDAEHKTLVLTLSAPVAGQPNAIPTAHIVEAIHPRYLAADAFEIAHALGTNESPAAIAAAADHIEREFRAFLSMHARFGAPPISVFGIAPIPLLTYLGNLIGNKRESVLYQLHRDGRWNWKSHGDVVFFEPAKKVHDGERDKIALLVNVSGRNGRERLPVSFADATVYELAPTGRHPSRTLIGRAEDLVSFRAAYRASLEQIRRDHRDPTEVGLFPAVPIPLAVAMGLDLLPKADPVLDVHDWRNDEFVSIIKVNK